ncbi:dispanin subfamily A member 2b-like [Danio aesculapii]|uniref:dispanin subfamily A member 2b-like n=1 Tax=Danio aesculapii TaxID=1142201 RepID=UPI0024C009B9|nr:dispanin subfamily A member 2b-like [Danio aesculapii]
MDRRQQAPDTVVLLQPQPPPAYYPPNLVQQGPYNQGPHPGQAVVSVQTVPAAPVPDYLFYSIFTMLCCHLSFLGIAALVFSLSTRNANDAGHRALAERNSKTARTLNNIACGLGIVFIVFAVGLLMLLESQQMYIHN